MSSSADLAIRLARAGFNRALVEGDLKAIGAVLAPGALLVAGTDSGVIAGRKAQLQAWKREFAAADRTLYRRTPETIELSDVEPIALEHGAWQGASAATGAVLSFGRYAAKWREIGGAWVIEAELYLTLA